MTTRYDTNINFLMQEQNRGKVFRTIGMERDSRML